MQVKVANLTFDLGDLEYEKLEPGLLSETELIIIGVCIGALVLVVIIILVIRRKITGSRRRRKYRELMAKLATLESSVRDQCKNAVLFYFVLSYHSASCEQ